MRALSGELDYRISYDVEHDLFHAQNVFNDEYITPTFVEYVQNLEKENAELKAKVYGGGYEAVITKKDADIILLEHLLKEQKELHKSVCDQLTHTHRNLGNQLTKAKELLAKWVELYKPKLEGYPITPIQEQTEQFLSEVEK